MTTQTQEAPRVYDRDLTAVLASVNGLFIVGASFRYAELEARIRMQMAMRKMAGRGDYQTPEWYAYRICENLRRADYAVIRDGVIEVKSSMASFLGYVDHWKGQRHRPDQYAMALDDYIAGFDA